MPIWLKHSLFFFFAGMAAWFVWCYIAPLGFDLFVVSMVLIVVVGIGWMRMYTDW